MSDVTQILNAIEQGNTQAAAELLPLVYEELRRLAAQKMQQERSGHTLQATGLVHEAYIRLVEAKNQSWSSRAHFFGAAAEAMRRILIENARRKKSLKRGGERQKVEFDESMVTAPVDVPPDEMLALDEAIEKLAARDKAKAALVKLRIFAGLTNRQAAELLGISQSKACEDLAYARAWLCLEMTKDDAR
jgi:RNA polymerase sigma factor (TIGR02999 family)